MARVHSACGAVGPSFRPALVAVALAGLVAWSAPRPAVAVCAGDCGGDRVVTIDELLTLVNIALGSAPVSSCRAGDAGDDGAITIDDILTAVNHALRACPPEGCVQPPEGMVAWYPLDDASGAEIRDAVRPGHPGTAGGGLIGDTGGPRPVPARVGGGLAFDGAASFVTVADAPALDFGRGDFSLDAWIQVDPTAGVGVRVIADKRDTASNGGVRGYQLFLFNGRLGVQLADAANGNNTCAAGGAACTNYVAAGPDLADGRPHHVAVTVQRAAPPAVTLYADGAAVLTNRSPRAGSIDNGAPLLIGHSEIGSAYFEGWIDELELFDRALAAAEVGSLSAASAAGKCHALHHFLCYRTTPLPGQPPGERSPGVRVENQFGASTLDVDPALTLCAPANKNDEDRDAPADPDHLRGYPVTGGDVPRLLPQTVVNQFGTLVFDVLAPTTLLVPSAKNLSAVPDAPLLPGVDHFLCHAVQRARGAAEFEPVPGVRVEDQFGIRLVDVVAPTRLCAPADKNGEAPGAARHAAHLMCYQVRLSPEVVQPPRGTMGPPTIVPRRFASPVDAVHTNDQFGPASFALVDVEELCVPSRKNPENGDGEALNCDDGIFCTEDRVVEYEPETDFDPPPSPTPAPMYTPPKEQGCEHDWKNGPAYGAWAFDPSGNNVSPCCEASSDCDDGDPCTHDVCAESEHRCYFEPLDPGQCGTAPIPAATQPPTAPCVDDATEPRLCDIQCVSGMPGEDCPTGQRPLELRPGAADVHHHLFDEGAYGARWRHGKVASSLHTCDGTGVLPPAHGRVATLAPALIDLALCAQVATLLQTIPGALPAFGLAADLGPPVFSELLGKEEGTWGDTGVHLQRRWPVTGWPRWDSMAHQRGQRDAVFKAWQDGLRLIVVTGGGFEPFCELLPANANTCDEMDDVDRQLALAHQFAAANSSWVEIALSPQHAMNIINAGKLAMVLAIETSDLFNDLFADPANPPDAAAIDAELQKYYDPPYDVRALQLAHETDNGFSGAALINPLFEVFEFADNRYGPSCQIDLFTCHRPRLGFDVYEDSDGVCKNALGLTAAGEMLVQAMMNRGMLIDLAHMPERSMLRTYALAKQNNYYPLFHSHTKLREMEVTYGDDPADNHNVIEHSVPAWVVQKIRRTGGLIGLRIGYLEQRTYTPSGVANTCQGSSRSLAQAYELARQGLKVPVALGTDLNAFTQNTRPRFVDRSLPGRPRQNPNGACAAGFKAEGICEAKAQSNKLGTAYDTRGLGDTGQTIDVLRDLEAVGLSAAAVSPLRDRSAEAFIRMWLRANDLPQPRNGPADLANDVDISGIERYVTKGTREMNYPQAPCLFGLFKPRYCPNSAQLGDPCRFDGECVAPLICGSSNFFCGLPESTCVCHGADIGCPAGYYCKLRHPLTAADNVCREKKDSGKPCLTKKECKSNQCKFTLNPFGPHCG